MVCREAVVDGDEMMQASCEQSGADRQHNRHRHLHDHQHATTTGGRSRSHKAGATQARSQIEARGLPGRTEAHDQPDEQRRTDADRDDSPVERDLRQPGQSGRSNRHQDIQRPSSEQQTRPTTGGRQHHALRGELTQEPATARAQRAADGQFAHPVRASRADERGNIRARHQQHQRGRQQQGDERGAHVADFGALHALHHGTRGVDRTAGKRPELRARALFRGAGRQARDHHELAVVVFALLRR